jgi:hypothetical protein
MRRTRSSLIATRLPAFRAAAALALAPGLVGCAGGDASASDQYLYIWMGDVDHADPDFFAVIDADTTSDRYGDVVATTTVPLHESLPHHTEYEMPAAGELLFANAHHAEKVLLIDFADPLHPSVTKMLDPVPPFRFPHDMTRLPNGNVLIGYLRSEGPSPQPSDSTMPGGHGGLAEVTARGEPIRSASAAAAGIDEPIRPYAFAMLPDIDRLVVTSAPMMESNSADVVQIWSLSELALLHTMRLPPALLENGEVMRTMRRSTGELAPSGDIYPFEPRLMPDGSVLLNAFGCGFYRLTHMDSDEPVIENVHTIEIEPSSGVGACGIPVVTGSFWVMPVGAENAVVTLDVSDPAHPREVARLDTGDDFAPHWMAKDPRSNRLILGAENGGENRMLMLRIDPATGALHWDERLRAKNGIPGIDFRRTTWPHGESGEAFGHAALFQR